MHAPALFHNHAALAVLPAARPAKADQAQALFSASTAGLQLTPAHS